MAKLVRKTFIQWGAQGPTSAFGEFGSKRAGTPVTSQDPDVIQGESAWNTGWQDAINTVDKAPYLEDMNGLHFVFSYMTAYLFQMGIPEWDSATTYFKNSVVQDNQGLGQWFVSLTDNNLGNQPPAAASNAQWKWVNPPTILDGGVTVGAVPKVSAANPGKLVDGLLSDDGVNMIIGGVAGTNGLKFPDGTVQKSALGPITSQNVVTGSRSFGTVFQNTSAKPMFVTVTGGGTAGGAYAVRAFSDANANPSTQVAQAGEAPGVVSFLFFIVLPGNYYKVVPDSGVIEPLLQWTEWL